MPSRHALERTMVLAHLEPIAVRNVLLRIAVWVSAGFLVSFGWGLYFAKTTKGMAQKPFWSARESCLVAANSRATEPAARTPFVTLLVNHQSEAISPQPC
jgi:hypothetical protein